MKFTVTVTRVSTYEVEATSYNEAEAIAVGVRGRKMQEDAFVDEDTVKVDVEQDSDVVQVKFRNTPGAKSYAYAVPEGIDYVLGDKLVVPARFDGNLEVVTVVGTGRGGYTGPLKSVFGKVATPQPKFDWDAVEDDEDEDVGFGVCPDCGIAFQNEDWEPCGGTIS